jgi:uncharacterized phage protein gp47/JayE
MPTENIPPAPVPVIDENGLTLPLFVDVQGWLQTAFREIYGQDIYIEPDSQDGQLIGILSKAFHDAYSTIGSAYNAFSPTTAQGIGLSRVVKINGIRRKIPTKSSVDLRIVGWAGTIIQNGIVDDELGNVWDLPTTVVIPPEAETIVTALARTWGEIRAAPNTITHIQTTVRGWQSVTNPEAATVGMPLEDDSMLRVRQSLSTALPSRSMFESLVGAVASIEGTNRYRGYDNSTTGVDEWNLPQNSISIVVEGGDVDEIAQVIYNKKAPGTATFGTTFATVIDDAGIPHKIQFSRPRQVPVQILIPIVPLARYTSSKDLAIRTNVSNWVNVHKIGDMLSVEEIGTPARLITSLYPMGDPTFRIGPPITVSRVGEDPVEEDVVVDYDERLTCTVDSVLLQIQA